MPTQTEKTFMQWLGTFLGDEKWRAIVRAQMQQHDLPIIQVGIGTRNSTSKQRRFVRRESVPLT